MAILLSSSIKNMPSYIPRWWIHHMVSRTPWPPRPTLYLPNHCLSLPLQRHGIAYQAAYSSLFLITYKARDKVVRTFVSKRTIIWSMGMYTSWPIWTMVLYWRQRHRSLYLHRLFYWRYNKMARAPRIQEQKIGRHCTNLWPIVAKQISMPSLCDLWQWNRIQFRV